MEKRRRPSTSDFDDNSVTDKMFGILSAGSDDNDIEIVSSVVGNLMAEGCLEQNLRIRNVPSDADIPMGVQFFAEYTDVDAVIVITFGGKELPEYILEAVMRLQLHWNMPVVFARNMADYWKVHKQAIEMVLLQYEMEADSADSDNPDRRSIN